MTVLIEFFMNTNYFTLYKALYFQFISLSRYWLNVLEQDKNYI